MVDEKFAESFTRISPNGAFFRKLGNFDAPLANSTTNGAEQVFFSNLGQALKLATETQSVEGLVKLWSNASDRRKVLVLGESIFALDVAGRANSELADWTFQSMNDFTTQLLKDMLGGEISEEQRDCAAALREWTCVASDYFEQHTTPKHAAQCMFVRAQLTSVALSTSPQLVGEAMVTSIRHLKGIRELDIAKDFCKSVCRDLEFLTLMVEQEEVSDEGITRRGIFWLGEACRLAEELGISEFKSLRRRVAKIIDQYGIQPYPDAPRLGPVIAMYLTPVEWMAEILTEFGNIDENDETALEDLCHDYGLTEHDSQVIDEALDSYLNGKPLLKSHGIENTYSDTAEVVFKAVELVKAQNGLQ